MEMEVTPRILFRFSCATPCRFDAAKRPAWRRKTRGFVFECRAGRWGAREDLWKLAGGYFSRGHSDSRSCPKRINLLTFWVSCFVPYSVMAPKDHLLVPGPNWATECQGSESFQETIQKPRGN